MLKPCAPYSIFRALQERFTSSIISMNSLLCMLSRLVMCLYGAIIRCPLLYGYFFIIKNVYFFLSKIRFVASSLRLEVCRICTLHFLNQDIPVAMEPRAYPLDKVHVQH